MAMQSGDYHTIFSDMDISAAIFRIEMKNPYTMKDAILEDCNDAYLDVAEATGTPRDEVLGRSYFDIVPAHDPRWNYYLYQAAILRNHVHGEFRNREYGFWTEFSGGPAADENTCWMVFINLTRYKNANEKLIEMSTIDQLTRVKNRNAYEDILEAYRAAEVAVGVVMVDLNGLKELNDEKGHKEGDRVIEETAGFLCTVSGDDLPYRIGGDEFVLLLEGRTREETEDILAQVRTFRETSLSAGAAWTDNSGTIDDAIRQADAAMYEDKKRFYQTHDRRHVE